MKNIFKVLQIIKKSSPKVEPKHAVIKRVLADASTATILDRLIR